MNTKIYACYNKDKKERRESSSGGVYSLLAHYVLENNGVVFAACYDAKLEVEHRKIENENDLPESRGSKYVASKLENTFIQIRSLLNCERKVLFVGTPCQCEGLLHYIGHDNNLVVVDVVCHGVPSRLVWESYLKSFKAKKGSNIRKVSMRDKSYGWLKFNCKFEDESGHETLLSQGDNPYLQGFVRDYYLRPSCYNCKFNGIEKNTDFTLGDFWGIQSINPDMHDDLGTSLLLIHSDKAMQIFDRIENKMVYAEQTAEDAVAFNPFVLKSADLTSKRTKFYKKLKRGEDFECIISDLLKETVGSKLRRIGKKVLNR